MNESFGIRIASDPVARLWSGVGGLIVPADIVEAAPAEYVGGGAILNAPDFQMLINGTAERLELQLSGVDDETVAIAKLEGPSVQGAKVHLVRFDFDDDWQLVGVEYEAVFRADKLTVSSAWESDQRVKTITLSIGSDGTNRSRAPIAFFTQQDQMRRSPDDLIFDHVSGITLGKSRRFGPR